MWKNTFSPRLYTVCDTAMAITRILWWFITPSKRLNDRIRECFFDFRRISASSGVVIFGYFHFFRYLINSLTWKVLRNDSNASEFTAKLCVADTIEEKKKKKHNNIEMDFAHKCYLSLPLSGALNQSKLSSVLMCSRVTAKLNRVFNKKFKPESEPKVCWKIKISNEILC